MMNKTNIYEDNEEIRRVYHKQYRDFLMRQPKEEKVR